MATSLPQLSDLDFVGLLDELSAAAYTCDRQGLITCFNSRAVDLWGRAPKLNDPVDSFCGSYKLFSPEGSPLRHDQCWMARALRENKAFNGCEILIERPDGTRLTALAHANPIRDKSGTLIGAVNVLVDTSDTKRDEGGSREVGFVKDERLAIVADELRNPLVSIRHMVDHLRNTPALEPYRVKRATDVLAAQVDQLTRLIDGLLDSGRIVRGTYEIRKRSIDLGTAVREVTDALRPATEARGHTLTVSVPPEPIRVEADAVRIAQILGNLLDHANRDIEGNGHIAVALSLLDGWAVLAVQDSGSGMPRDFLPHVLEPFVRSDIPPRHPRGGLGLGLSITKTLVEMHGGVITVDSSGEGSTFTVRLPAANAVERHPCSPAFHTRAPRRILIVDDDAAVADSFSALLALMGHEVAVAPDGPSAVALARKISPDVAFVDIDLPGMDGYELAGLLRQEHSAERMLLVAATGYTLNEARSRAAGFDHHLTKPIDIRDLETVLSVETRPRTAWSSAEDFS